MSSASIYILPIDVFIPVLEYVNNLVLTMQVNKWFRRATLAYLDSTSQDLKAVTLVNNRYLNGFLFVNPQTLPYLGKRMNLTTEDKVKIDRMPYFLFVDNGSRPSTVSGRLLKRTKLAITIDAERLGLPPPSGVHFVPLAQAIAQKEAALDASVVALYEALVLPAGHQKPPVEGANSFEKAQRIRIWMEANKPLLGSIEELVIPPDDLKFLPPEIRHFIGLTKLTMTGCNLKELPDELGLLQNLKILEAGENQLFSLPSSMRHLQRLEELELNDNKFSQFPPVIYEQRQLRHLVMGGNLLETFPKELCDLTNLEILDYANPFPHFPPEIRKLKYLKSLSIGGKNDLNRSSLNELPLTLGTLPRLTDLFICNCSFSEFPQVVLQLKTLNTLDLRSNDIATLPEDLDQLTELTTLNVNNNLLTTLPISMSRMGNLTTLKVSSNLFQRLPPVISQMPQLTHIDFSDNFIRSLDPSLASTWTNAVELDFRGNHFNSLPDELLGLPRLQINEVEDEPMGIED